MAGDSYHAILERVKLDMPEVMPDQVDLTRHAIAVLVETFVAGEPMEEAWKRVGHGGLKLLRELAKP
jgi:hypothetical protein